MAKPGTGNWLFGMRGRLSRSQWWLGLVVTATIFVSLVLIGCVLIAIFAPVSDADYLQKMKDPAWAATGEGQNFLKKMNMLLGLMSLTLLVPLWNLIALSIKRLHDRGAPGWRVLIVIVPFFLALSSPLLFAGMPQPQQAAWLLYGGAAVWALVQFGVLAGEAGSNQYGDAPVG